MPDVGDLIAGKYRLERIVGRGGMGVVFAARHVHLQQSVAIKVLQLALDDERREEWIARFFHEGRIAAGLRSEHVAQVHDLGLLEGSNTPYMVMELLEGADLAALLGWQKRLSVEQAVECVRQAGSAIAIAHKRGIVHRDLKPSNLFVTTRLDGSGLIKVLDFGISKSLDQQDEEGSLTASRAVLGSPFYMSPEQIRDAKRVDHRTDIWSLGAILHELLRGSPPFEADTLPAACAAIVADPPPSIRKLRDDVPEALESIILRCLEKAPEDRFNFAGDLVVALQPFCAAARGHAPPQFELGQSLLEAAARAATPADLAGSSKAPVSETLKAAMHEGVQDRRLNDPISSDDEESLVGSDSDPESSVDAMSVTLSSQDPSSTLQSSARPDSSPPDARDSATTADPDGRTAAKRWPLVALSVALLLAAVVWFGGSTKEPATTPGAASGALLPQPPQAETFSLLIESLPNGAEVYENNERLGTTPLSIKVTQQSVATHSRVFELRRDGYETYHFEQKASEDDTTHVARMVELAKPSPSVDTSTTPPVGPAPPKKNVAETPPRPTPEATDIKMSR